jgi:Icc-related predicted phosphoesterase
MTKILCVGDIHAMDRPPVNATETYMDDIIEMLLWTIDYAVEQGIPTIVWAGDIFHHKAPSRTSHALVLRMIKVVEYARSKGIELICVTGNHDITNDRLESLERQPLGVLYAAGLRELVGWHEELPLFGVPWRQDWTTNEDAPFEAFAAWRSTLGVDNDDQPPMMEGPALAVTHAPIYPPGSSVEERKLFNLVPTQGEHGLAEAMGHTGFLYYGHIHEDHGIFEVEGVTFANMGAISRGSLTEYNVEREIKVAVWEVEGEYAEFREVVVPHKPAKIEEAQERKEAQISLDAFLADVGSRTLDVSTTAAVVTHIREREDVPERVKKRAIEILEEVG